MVYTTREIIKRAKELAQVNNSRAFSFSLLIHLVNNCYTNLYNDVCGISNSFVEYFTFTGESAELPSNCNKVLSVYIDNEYINQSSNNRPIDRMYYIENNVLHIVGKKDSKEVKVKYSVLPIVLTAPGEMIEIEDPNNTYAWLGCSFDWNTKKVTLTRAAEPTADYFHNSTIKWNDKWNGGDLYWKVSILEPQRVYLERDGETIDLDFKRYDSTGKEIYIAYIQVSDPYAVVSYVDGTIRIYTGIDGTYADYNYNILKGKGTYGEVRALTTDDETGYGMVLHMNDKWYYASYMPDTVISYPNNAFFDVLIDRLAIQLQSLQGLDNSALNKKLEYDEESFYNSLIRSNQGNRIRNDYPVSTIRGGF